MGVKFKNILYIVLTFILFFAGRLLWYAVYWSLGEYGKVPFAQIIFHLKVPLSGTGSTVISDFIGGYVWTSLAFTLIVLASLIVIGVIGIKRPEGIRRRKPGKKQYFNLPGVLRRLTIGLAAAHMVGCIVYGWVTFDIGEYIYDMRHPSTVYEDYYVDASSVDITFPEKKKNLIYIFCESMEDTYASVEVGGAMGDNLIPNLTQLALDNQCFASEGMLNGCTDMANTTWTVAGMVAQTSGIPLSIPISENSYGHYSSFLPGVTSLGELLDANGYNQMIMMGSDSDFGGRSNYFNQHGDYYIYDLFTARNRGKIAKDYYEWWGFEDEKLFEYAKEEITNLAAKDEPFNFTMLTADTHFPNGYECHLCGHTHGSQLQNVITCSDAQLGQFVAWIQAQDFYDDTVIVIAGDHNNMATAVNSWYADGEYERQSYAVIINSDTQAQQEGQNRVYTRMDLFPTTLAAMGCSIEGDRLGLGTNLYSDEATLVELLGPDKLNKELEKTSKLYDDKILN